MAVLIALHLLAAIVWIGGMFFAYVCLRPALGDLDPPDRCRLWNQVLKRFFAAVWVAAALLLVTGYAMIGIGYGGMAAAGLHIHLMQGLGILMVLLFGHVYFAPYRRLSRAVAAVPEAFKLVGGGSTVSVIEELGLRSEITHVSTGGGASLEYVQGLELPGVAALED